MTGDDVITYLVVLPGVVAVGGLSLLMLAAHIFDRGL